MDELRLTRSYLETLATCDLAALAGSLGLDLPPDLNRIFVIEEILDARPDDLGETEGEDLDGLRIEGQAAGAVEALPESYNTTFIEVLIRDPVWAFAFWEIRPQDREAYERAPDFGGYRLRVSAVGGARKGPEDSFYIALDKKDSAWYVCFPSAKGWFKVELCAVRNQCEQVLASSQPFRIPSCGDLSVLEVEEHPLRSILALSGGDEFRILKSVDRASRLPQRCEF